MSKKNVIKQISLWGFLIVLFLYVSFLSLSSKPTDYPPYLSHSPSPTGVKAFYTYVNDVYEDVMVWDNPPSYLPKRNENALLIMIEPYYIPNKEEHEQYEAFISSGNTILLFHENPAGMFNVKIDYSEHFLPDSGEEPQTLYGLNDEEYDADVSSSIRLVKEEGDEVLIEDEHGNIVALKKNVGEGVFIVATTPHWLTNGAILHHDHIPLILSLIDEGHGGGSIYFDENIHGASASLLTVYPHTFLVIMFQGGIIVLLFLWYRGKRFGPIFEPREASARFSDEEIKALAAWNLRLKENKYVHSLHTQAKYTKQKLQEKWGIPYYTDWEASLPALEKKWTNISKEEIEKFLAGLVNILNKDDVAKQEYLFWSKRLDELRREVEKG